MAMVQMVIIWKTITEKATLLDSRIPSKDMPAKTISMRIVKTGVGNGNEISPARYEPALAAETIAWS